MADQKTKVRIETAFLAIPDAIARDKELSASAKLLFGCVYSLSMTENACYGSNRALGERTGISLNQVQRLLPELERRGLIKRRIKGNGHERATIEVTWKGKRLKPSTPTPKMGVPPYPQNGGTPTPKMGVGPHYKEDSRVKDEFQEEKTRKTSLPSPNPLPSAARARRRARMPSSYLGAPTGDPTIDAERAAKKASRPEGHSN